jgi:DNA invertase Pin-like site-specific DNA recombinase
MKNVFFASKAPMKAISYIRVSTQKQGKSGLGLEAQVAAIDAYTGQNGLEIVATYREIESGKVNDRPQLAKALAHAKKAKAALVVAKLDRLARNVAFVSQVMDSGVEFVACDNPFATRLTLHILAAVAEHEAAMIAARTKAALAAAKARGVRLGSRDKERLVTARARKAEIANSRAKNIAAVISDIERAGIKTLAGIAEALSARGIKTPRGNESWAPTQVARIKAMAS